MDNSVLVSNHLVNVCRSSSGVTTDTGSSSPHSKRRDSNSEGTNATNRLARFGKSLTDRGISQHAKELITSAWRDSTNKNCDSAWRKWETWCSQKHINPLSAPIESILSFLAFQFHSGYKYRSLNVYRSAISSIHPRIDGFEVGQTH